MSSYLLHVDMAGFRDLAGSLSKGCEVINYEEDDSLAAIRQVGLRIASFACELCSGEILPWGSDSWVLKFSSQEEVLCAAKLILLRSYQAAATGLPIFKPVLAVGFGQFKSQDQQPTDSTSINLHAAAEAKPLHPFTILISESANFSIAVTSIGLTPMGPPVSVKGENFTRYKLNDDCMSHDLPLLRKIALSDSLQVFHSIVSDTELQSTGLMKQLHEAASVNVRVIGGGAPFTRSIYKNYAINEPDILRKKQHNSDFKFLRIAMLYEKEAVRSYYWLHFNARLVEEFGSTYQFRFIDIPDAVPKPLSFHVIDNRFVFIGLRHYNAESETLTMKNAVCCDSQVVSHAFSNVFDEYWRVAKHLTPDELRAKAEDLPIGDRERKAAKQTITRAFRQFKAR